ncbi:MAG: KH domain-containing protein [Candidatus Paceibacterota bacterium]
MADKQFDQEFVEFIVKSIVDHADDVQTERVVDEMGTLISLHVKAEDMATIIGKEGRTAKALRTILQVLGARHNERINLKIIEPEGGRGFFPAEEGEAPLAPATAKTTAKSSAMADALKDIPQDEIA